MRLYKRISIHTKDSGVHGYSAAATTLSGGTWRRIARIYAAEGFPEWSAAASTSGERASLVARKQAPAAEGVR
jgi:hypothetical protein